MITNARLTSGAIVDITVDDDGIVAGVEPASRTSGTVAADGSIDADGLLVLPAPCEPHAHLDKALTAERVPNPAGDLMGAITAWRAAIDNGMCSFADVVDRARRAVELLVSNGVVAVRSHVDLRPSGDQIAVRALAAVREELADVVTMQIVALPHGEAGILNRQPMLDAIDAGVDLLGGCPHLEHDGAAVIDQLLGMAVDHGCGVDLHMDETLDPDVLWLPELARQVMSRNIDVAVTASHCVSLGMVDVDQQRAVAAAVAEAGVSVVALPQTNLYLQGRDMHQAMPRGLTAIEALVEAGATVCAGADNVADPFNLVGRSDPFETASLLVMAAHRSPERAWEMVSTNARRTMGLAPAGPTVGQVGDLLLVDAESVRDAIANAPGTRRTIRGGQLVARADQSRGLVSKDSR